MNQDEFKKLRMTVVDMLCGDDLVDKTPRTLLYGVGGNYECHIHIPYGVDFGNIIEDVIPNAIIWKPL
jgi:hypothetical protein